MPSLEANQLLASAVDAADSKKAEDIRILALDPSESALTDYFLICSGTNERQNAAIADEIEGRLKREFGVYANSVEGRRQGEWILMDYVDFVVHIFMPEKREHYGLERLRKTAKSISAAELNQEITKAISAARKKTPAREEKEGTGEAPATAKKGGKTGRKTSSKVAAAISEKAPGKKSAAKKTAAKKTVEKRNVIPQPAAKSKKTAAKKVVKKSAAKKSAK